MTVLCKTKDCGQMLEIKTASGGKNPENKGRQFTTCLKCKAFNWVEANENPKTTEEFKESLESPATPQKEVEQREPIQQTTVDKKVWENKDLRIARESALHSATRNHEGHEVDPALIVLEAEEYVKYIYEGLNTSEDIDSSELPDQLTSGG